MMAIAKASGIVKIPLVWTIRSRQFFMRTRFIEYQGQVEYYFVFHQGVLRAMGQHTLQKNYEPVSIDGLVCRCVMLCQHEIGRMTWNLLLEITSTIFTVPLFS